MTLALKGKKDASSNTPQGKHDFILKVVTGKIPVPLSTIDLPSAFKKNYATAFHKAL